MKNKIKHWFTIHDHKECGCQHGEGRNDFWLDDGKAKIEVCTPECKKCLSGVHNVVRDTGM